eukprot:g33005.t1
MYAQVVRIESIFPACGQYKAEQLQDTANQTRQQNYITYMHTKNKKLEKLGTATSNNQASPGNGTLCENLSGYVEDILKPIVQGTPRIQFFIQTHGTAMGARFAPQYANIFMHRFEQDFSAVQGLQPTLYTRCIDDIFFLWTHGKESLKSLHSDINKFHPTIRLTMEYSLESVSFLDIPITIRDGHLSISLYCKPTGNLTMLHFSSFYPKHIKEVIPYGQALCIHRICSDKEECNGHLIFCRIRKRYDAQLIDRQFRCATARNCNNLLRRKTQGTTDRVPFVIQYFPGAERLRHVLHSLQYVINDNQHLTKIFPTPWLLTFKQPPNLKQTIVHSLRDNNDHNATQPCNLCKTCQIIDMDPTTAHGNTTHHVHGRYS